MKTIRSLHILAASLLSGACLAASAAPTPPAIRAEIHALMSRMKASGCQFERNGSWHNAADAQKHLLRKLAYIEEQRDTLASTEQFIEVAASKSSLSGKPYRVKCGNGEPVPSASWLKRELKLAREAAARP